MTDARMPDRWLYDPSFDGLSDRAWRTFAASLMWGNGAGTDGELPSTQLRFLHPLGVDEATAKELIDAGKWEVTGSGYQVLNWQKSQSLAADVEKQRERNRGNVKAYRQRKSESPDDIPGDDQSVVSGDNIDYETGEVLGVPVGQDRTGKDALRGSELKLAGTGKRATKIAAVPADASVLACGECQRMSAFESGPCPRHRSETA